MNVFVNEFAGATIVPAGSFHEYCTLGCLVFADTVTTLLRQAGIFLPAFAIGKGSINKTAELLTGLQVP